MRRLFFALPFIVAGALPAAAQRMAPDPLAGVARPPLQDLSTPGPESLRARPRPAQGFQAERAVRASRQAVFNRHFPGTPARLFASRR